MNPAAHSRFIVCPGNPPPHVSGMLGSGLLRRDHHARRTPTSAQYFLAQDAFVACLSTEGSSHSFRFPCSSWWSWRSDRFLFSTLSNLGPPHEWWTPS